MSHRKNNCFLHKMDSLALFSASNFHGDVHKIVGYFIFRLSKSNQLVSQQESCRKKVYTFVKKDKINFKSKSIYVPQK